MSDVEPFVPEAAGTPPADGGERPVIKIVGGDIHTVAPQVEALLGDRLFARANQLVRLGEAAELTESATRRDESQAVIIPATPEWIVRNATARAKFALYQSSKKDFVEKDCPTHIANNILGQGSFPGFRQLDSIARAPFFRPDGSVCSTAGFDTATRTFYLPNAHFPPIPTDPTRSEYRDAMKALRKPIEEFPFATESARTVPLAHLCTLLLAPMLPTRPVFVYSAPVMATGKTLLARLSSVIATGSEPALHPYSDAEELRKVMLSSLRSGDVSLLFDNLLAGSRVRAAVLCAFATAPLYADRVLGSSVNVAIPNHCTLALTGNNLVPAGDLARRSLVARLDTNSASARGRTFAIPNLISFALEHRARLVVAALTIIRAYVARGCPAVDTRPIESFEDWGRWVRDPLVWVGFRDPVQTQATDTDEDIDSLALTFAVIAKAFPHEFFYKDLATKMKENADLRNALEEAGCRDEKLLRIWLRQNHDRVGGNLKLVKVGSANNANAWMLRKQNEVEN